MMIAGLGLYGFGANFWIYGMSRQSLISVYPFTILRSRLFIGRDFRIGRAPTRLGLVGVALFLLVFTLSRETRRKFSGSDGSDWPVETTMPMELAKKALASRLCSRPTSRWSVQGVPSAVLLRHGEARPGRTHLDVGCGVGASLATCRYRRLCRQRCQRAYITRATADHGHLGKFVRADVTTLTPPRSASSTAHFISACPPPLR